jgi:hypothetical protein
VNLIGVGLAAHLNFSLQIPPSLTRHSWFMPADRSPSFICGVFCYFCRDRRFCSTPFVFGLNWTGNPPG